MPFPSGRLAAWRDAPEATSHAGTNVKTNSSFVTYGPKFWTGRRISEEGVRPMPYHKGNRKTWVVTLPTRDGRRRRVSTGTAHGSTATLFERMICDLGPSGSREWDLLDRVADGTLTRGVLFDAWNTDTLDALRSTLNHVDVEPFVAATTVAAKPVLTLIRGNAQRRANPKAHTALDATGAGGLEPPTVALTVRCSAN